METWRKVLSQEVNCEGWVGPSSPLLAENDKCYRAFLNCPDEITYDASGASNGDTPTWHCKLAAKGKSLDAVDCQEPIEYPGGNAQDVVDSTVDPTEQEPTFAPTPGRGEPRVAVRVAFTVGALALAGGIMTWR